MSRSSTQSPPPLHPHTGRPLAAIILAAGKGVRMNSDLPKVVHEVAGRPIVWWVVDAVRKAGANPIVLVVGHGGEHVRAIFEDDDDDIRYVLQDRQLGTGHATLCAQEALAEFEGDVLVLAGDGPLIRPKTIEVMHEAQRAARAAATLATSVIEDPTGYGRVIRGSDGRFQEIVEHKNATPEQRAIHEIYPSYACFDANRLFAMLRQLEPNELAGEYYLTDIPALLRDGGEVVELVDAVPPEDVLSINTPQQLAEVDAILTARRETAQMEKSP
ncbi:MAG: NTP transferase domain-containing protein [Phycisphaerales bacterium]|nr:MAG: NTP transferase domain-containing protein [Phycisphaerales bacterium]